ncbi:NAD-binding protein [Mycena rebaudengoi]|nr:NAD-binding protein [Mycena rebaudengoi]
MGNLLPTLFPSHFISERDIPDLSGKIILVTGGNSGIGYETVKQLLAKNAKVYLAARSAEKAAKAINSLEEETKKRAIFILLDLADLHSVRRAAEAFLAQEKRLDILFNNGGVMSCPPDMLTAQKHDLQFGTNVIGHYFLTELLIPALTTSYNETQVPARVINTSSIGHQMAANAGVELESLKDGPSRDAWLKKNGSFVAPWRLYGESKLGNILVSNYFARVHSDVLVSTALHPGAIRSELARHRPGWQQWLIDPFLFPPQMGAYTQLWAGTVATPMQITGQYLVPWAKVGKASKSASDTKLEAQVIAYIKEQIKGF